MGILDEDLINGTPEEDFVLNVATFAKTYDNELWEAMREYASKHFTKISGKLCWKKYHYFAITKPGKYPKWNGEKYVDCEKPKKLIIASECLIKDSWGRYDCVVFRATGKTGPKERRGQWFKTHRSQDDPVLSSGWKFSDYDIYQIPADMIGYLYGFLPHKPESKPDPD